MRKLLQILKMRARGALYVGTFAPLADYSPSEKLSGLYSGGQDLPVYINSIFKVAISVGAILAVLRLGYAGYMYMGGDMWGNKQHAKDMIRDVFIGLFLLLSVWIILYQINPDILKLNIVITPLPAVVAPPPSAVSPANQTRLNAILADESRARTSITGTNANIGFNAGPCTSLTQTSGCTNVGLLPSMAVGRLDSLQRACNCAITISGGTEFWMHASHDAGVSVVDLRADSGLLDFIHRTYPDTRVGSVYQIRLPGGGGNFYYENPAHFHVTFF